MRYNLDMDTDAHPCHADSLAQARAQIHFEARAAEFLTTVRDNPDSFRFAMQQAGFPSDQIEAGLALLSDQADRLHGLILQDSGPCPVRYSPGGSD